VAERRLCTFRVSAELLADLLHLPEGHNIVAVLPQDNYALANQHFEFMAEGPSLPIHVEGCPAPWMRLVLSTDDERGEFVL